MPRLPGPHWNFVWLDLVCVCCAGHNRHYELMCAAAVPWAGVGSLPSPLVLHILVPYTLPSVELMDSMLMAAADRSAV